MKAQITVINTNREKPRLPFVGVYVGRPSSLGNPYKLMSESQRPMILTRFEEWLRYRLRTVNPTSTRLAELVAMAKEGQALALECHCAPKACHADVIKKLIEEELEKSNAV